MLKKFPIIPALCLALLLPAKTYSQDAKPSPTAKPSAQATPSANDYSGLSPDNIIEKLQDQIITWQDEIIRGMEAEPIMQSLYRDMAAVAMDTSTGKVKDQKVLDLLSKYGLGLKNKDGKKLNTPADESSFLKLAPETVPFIEVKDNATREQKDRIRDLREKGLALVDKATLAKRWVVRLQIAAIDLLELSKTDPGAQSLVDKYHIKQHAPIPSASPAPSPGLAP